MPLTRARLSLGALGTLLAASLTLAPLGAAADSTTLTPDSGPVAGGTTVTLEVENTGLKFESIAALADGAIALANDGNAYTWGWSHYGALGLGDTSSVDFPTKIQMPNDVAITQLSSGGSHALAIGADGNVYAWGSNSDGQIGNGETGGGDDLIVNLPTQVQFPDGVTITTVEAAPKFSLAIDSTGAAWSWGSNFGGQLGTGDEVDHSMPTKISTPAGVTFTQLASMSFETSLALASDGTAWAWGHGYDGGLGNGSIETAFVPVPVAMPAGITFTQISGHYSDFTAVGSDGNVYAWGADNSGIASSGHPTAREDDWGTVPVMLPTKVNLGVDGTVTSVSDGETNWHATATTTTSGIAYSWGLTDDGQGGSGAADDQLTPRAVDSTLCADITQVSGGSYNSFALGCGGKAYAWGNTYGGSLGDVNASMQSNVPLAVVMPGYTLTSVTFDGIPGTELTHVEGNTWTVVTPAHAAGPVDVVATSTENQTGETVEKLYASGYTYLDAAVTPEPPTESGEPGTSAPAATDNPDGDAGADVTTGGEQSTNLLGLGAALAVAGAASAALARRKHARR